MEKNGDGKNKHHHKQEGYDEQSHTHHNSSEHGGHMHHNQHEHAHHKHSLHEGHENHNHNEHDHYHHVSGIGNSCVRNSVASIKKPNKNAIINCTIDSLKSNRLLKITCK